MRKFQSFIQLTINTHYYFKFLLNNMWHSLSKDRNCKTGRRPGGIWFQLLFPESPSRAIPLPCVESSGDKDCQRRIEHHLPFLLIGPAQDTKPLAEQESNSFSLLTCFHFKFKHRSDRLWGSPQLWNALSRERWIQMNGTLWSGMITCPPVPRNCWVRRECHRVCWMLVRLYKNLDGSEALSLSSSREVWMTYTSSAAWNMFSDEDYKGRLPWGFSKVHVSPCLHPLCPQLP